MSKLIFLLFAILNVSASIEVDKRPVVSVHFFSDNGRWTDHLVRGFREEVRSTLKNKNFVDVYHLENTPQEISKVTDQILRMGPSLVYLPDDNLFLSYAEALTKKGVPVVSSAITRSPEETAQQSHSLKEMSVIHFFWPDTFRALHVLKKITKTQRILVIGGPSEIAKKLVSRVAEDLNKVPNVDFEVRNLKYWEDWKKELRNSEKKYDLVWMFLPFLVERRDNRIFSWEDAGTWLEQNLKVPTVGFTSAKSPIKRTFSFGVSGETLGRIAGKSAVEILKGSPIASIKPPVIDELDLAVDVNQLAKLKLRMPDDLALVATSI